MTHSCRAARTRRRRRVGLMLLGLWALSAAADPAWQPLSEAERHGVALALAYADQGPEAWWRALAAGSPLTALGQDAALAEIEVRAGSPAGARWQLQTVPETAGAGTVVFAVEYPSGVDDVLFLELVLEAGRWKLFNLRTLAEPLDPDRVVRPTEAGSAPEPPPAPLPRWLLAIPLLALSLLGAAIWLWRRGRPLPAYAVTGSALVLMAVPFAVMLRSDLSHPGATSEGSAAAARAPQLRALLPLRRAMTRADSALHDATEQPEPPPGTLAADVADLWRVQMLMAQMHLNQADGLLESAAGASSLPLAELLRARLALLRLEDVDAAVAYENLLASGLDHDGLLVEAAQAFLRLGFDQRAEETLAQALELGTRRADVYYLLSELAVLQRRPGDAEAHLRTAWAAEPRRRSEILGTPLLAVLLEEAWARRLVAVSSPLEPTAACPAPRPHPLTLPPTFEAWPLGALLRLTDGATEILVPAGCELAPAGTPLDDPVAHHQRQEERVLRRLSELLDATRAPGALAQPALYRPVELAARALARLYRWPELIELTDSLPDSLSSLPGEIIWLRAQALNELGRQGSARRLLIQLAKENSRQRRADPVTLLRLAQLFLKEGEHDLARRLTAKANSLLPFPASGDRLRRIQLEKRLAESFGVAASRHFELRFPTSWNDRLIQEAIRVLEAEYQRLQTWIPVQVEGRIEVHFLPVDDFRTGFSPDFGVVGLFDGSIRLPFGEVWSFEPIVVAILSHELAHAMIARYTENRAPIWFQEGLAQHVQMLQGRINPIGDFQRLESLLAVPLLDAAIQGYSPQLTAVGYDEANWAIHYVESRYGVEVLHRLMDSFREGRSTEEALAAALGLSLADFDRNLWQWCLHDAPRAWPVELIRYDRRDRRF